MAEIGLTIPYLRQTPSGYYWEPSRRIRPLGFSAEPLGKDAAEAIARAQTLNAQVEAALKGGPPAAPVPVEGTVAWVVERYKASNAWKDLATARLSDGTWIGAAGCALSLTPITHGCTGSKRRISGTSSIRKMRRGLDFRRRRFAY